MGKNGVGVGVALASATSKATGLLLIPALLAIGALQPEMMAAIQIINIPVRIWWNFIDENCFHLFPKFRG